MRIRTRTVLPCVVMCLACQAQITVNMTMPMSICEGSALSVDYTAIGVFNAGNIFTVELSDAFGSFAAPVVIGNLPSVISGTVACMIPGGTPGGNGYLFRVNADNPVTTGSAGPYTVTVVSAPDAGVSMALPWCLSDGPFNMIAQLGGTPDPGGYWIGPGGGAGDNVFDPGIDPSGVYAYVVQGIPPCPNAVATLAVAVNMLCMTGTPLPAYPTY